MVLVYDVKLSQLGRKNLAVRFNLIRSQIGPAQDLLLCAKHLFVAAMCAKHLFVAAWWLGFIRACRVSANLAMSRGTMALGQSQRVKFERRQLAAVRKELDQEYEAMAGLDAKPSKDGNPALTENAAEDWPETKQNSRRQRAGKAMTVGNRQGIGSKGGSSFSGARIPWNTRIAMFGLIDAVECKSRAVENRNKWHLCFSNNIEIVVAVFPVSRV